MDARLRLQKHAQKVRTDTDGRGKCAGPDMEKKKQQ